MTMPGDPVKILNPSNTGAAQLIIEFAKAQAGVRKPGGEMMPHDSS
jgi:hypothetical protein